MRLDDYRTSDNVSDQRGQSFGGGGGGLGGGALPMILGLVASRFGIGGVLILALGYCALQYVGGGAGTAPSVVAPGQRAGTGGGGGSAAQACAVDQASRFSCQVLASTEDTWQRIFAEQRQTYRPAGFVF